MTFWVRFDESSNWFCFIHTYDYHFYCGMLCCLTWQQPSTVMGRWRWMCIKKPSYLQYYDKCWARWSHWCCFCLLTCTEYFGSCRLAMYQSVLSVRTLFTSYFVRSIRNTDHWSSDCHLFLVQEIWSRQLQFLLHHFVA